MPPRYVRFCLCPPKHPDDPFFSSKIDESDTCRVDLNDLGANQDLEHLRTLWAQTINASFDIKLLYLDRVNAETVQFHPHKKCDEALSFARIASKYTSSVEDIRKMKDDDIHLVWVHINDDGPCWGLGPVLPISLDRSNEEDDDEDDNEDDDEDDDEDDEPPTEDVHSVEDGTGEENVPNAEDLPSAEDVPSAEDLPSPPPGKTFHREVDDAPPTVDEAVVDLTQDPPPTEAPDETPRLARAKSRFPTREPLPCNKRNEEGEIEFPEMGDDSVLVRVGRIASSEADQAQIDDEEHIIKTRTTVVAVVKGQNVQYLTVPTWTINGQDVGSYAFGEAVASINDVEDFGIDTFWRAPHSIHQLDAAVWNYVRIGCEPQAKRDYTYCHPLDRLRSQGHTPMRTTEKGTGFAEYIRAPDTGRPYKAPERPIHTQGVAKDEVSGTPPEDEGNIAVVVCFTKSPSLHLDYALPKEFHCDLNSDNNVSTFAKFLEAEPLFDDNDEEDILDAIANKSNGLLSWDVDVWVLPQWETEKLYPWTDEDGRTAGDFLDSYVSRVWGKQLFIEVRLVEDANYRKKQREWYEERRKVAKGNTAEDPWIID